MTIVRPNELDPTGDGAVAASEKRAVVYLRVSSASQVNKDYDPEGFSIPAQREACHRRAEQLGASVAAEYVEYGESGTSLARRVALKRLLTDLPAIRPELVIVYDISRLARDEGDAMALFGQINEVGAKLESVSENIDATPAGRLLYAVMSAVNAFRSRGDAEKVRMGLQRKHEAGGTPGVAPLGYLNVTEMVGGRTVRTIAVDAERSDFIKVAFDAYASGEFTISGLTQMLEDIGLRTVPRGTRISRPVSRSYVHKMLSNPYYVGVVEYDGVRRPGRHEPLIDQATFDRVQQLLAAHALAGDRSHKHQHYLKGTVYCAICGARLTYGRHRGKMGVHYEYFGCVARTRHKQPCRSGYLPLADVERAVEAHWGTVVYKPDEIQRLRDSILGMIESRIAVAEREVRRQEERCAELEDQQVKLLQLYYEGVVKKEMLRREQERIDAERGQAEAARAVADVDLTDVKEALDEALTLAANPIPAYSNARPEVRRLFNQSLFKRLIVGPDLEVEGIKTDLYRELDAWLNEGEGQVVASVGASRSIAAGVEQAQAPISRGLGSNNIKMVRTRGLEPPRPCGH